MFASPVEVVHWFGAIQSQDLPASLYAIGLRMTGATEAIVESALTNGSIVRSWPMRRTIHCMAAEDVRWMIRMLAPRAIARMKPYHRAMKITDEDLARAGRVSSPHWRANRGSRAPSSTSGLTTRASPPTHRTFPCAVCIFSCIGPRLD